MKRGEWHERARQLRREGYTIEMIARLCGVTYSAVYKVLNPHRAADYNRRAESKPGRREAKRAADSAWRRTDAVRGACANPCCSELRGTGATLQREKGYCRDCIHAIANVRRTLAEGMWAAGWVQGDMKATFGVSGQYFQAMRARGWDLPHRRTPEQIERIRSARHSA